MSSNQEQNYAARRSELFTLINHWTLAAEFASGLQRKNGGGVILDFASRPPGSESQGDRTSSKNIYITPSGEITLFTSIYPSASWTPEITVSLSDGYTQTFTDHGTEPIAVRECLCAQLVRVSLATESA